MSPVVVLVGLPASGKTTAGRRLALRLGVPFADTDSLVVARAGSSIVQIFAERGEAEFRRMEQDVIGEAVESFGGVLALGGGAVLSPVTRALLTDSRVPVGYLTTTPSHALRFVRSGRDRPLLAGDAAARLAVLADERGPLYEQVATARIVSGGRPLRYVVNDLVRLAHRNAS